MNRIFHIFWLLTLSISAHSFQLPADFEATYQIKKYNALIAEMKLTLKQTDNDIVYKSYSETRGLAAIFSSEKITESSHLLWSNSTKTPRLHQYNYTRKNKPKKNQRFSLNWSDDNTATATGIFNNNPFQLDIKDQVWDRLFVQLVISSDLQNSDKIKKTYSYNIIDKSHLTQFHFEYIADEEIQIDNINHDTVKFKRTHASGKRVSYFWLSKKLHYLPIKIEQYKKGKPDLSMTLSNINFFEKAL